MQNRNYQLYFNSIEGSISYQYKTSVKVTASHKYAQKVNKQGDEQSYNNNSTLEFNYTIPQKGSLMLKATYCYILFSGDESSSAGYEMLEALSTGNNGIIMFIKNMSLLRKALFHKSHPTYKTCERDEKC